MKRNILSIICTVLLIMGLSVLSGCGGGGGSGSSVSSGSISSPLPEPSVDCGGSACIE